MKRTKLLLVAALALVICLPGMAGAVTTFYTEAAFQADINPGYYLEDFDSVTAGSRRVPYLMVPLMVSHTRFPPA